MLISIHEVTHRSLSSVITILQTLSSIEPPKIMLLVVPESGWNKASLNALSTLQDAGYPLAGHGWKHYCHPPHSLKHKIHSRLISQNVAEHLPLNEVQIFNLISDCYYWFEAHDLNAPTTYVPPARVMGSISRGTLSAAPFRYYETTGGILDSKHNKFYPLPLLGFAADTWLRARFLRFSNAINAYFARNRNSIRVAIHPNDFQLRLFEDLHKWFETINNDNLILKQNTAYTSIKPRSASF